MVRLQLRQHHVSGDTRNLFAGDSIQGIASSPYEQPSRPLHLLKTALRSDCLKRRQCVHSISAGIMVMLTLCIRSFTHPTRHACAMRLVDRTEWRIMGVPALLQHAVRIALVSLHPPTMLGSKVGIIVHSVRSAICGHHCRRAMVRRAISEAARHLMRPTPAAEGAQWCGAPSAMRRAT